MWAWILDCGRAGEEVAEAMVASPMPRWNTWRLSAFAAIMLAIEVVVLLGFAWVVFVCLFRSARRAAPDLRALFAYVFRAGLWCLARAND